MKILTQLDYKKIVCAVVCCVASPLPSSAAAYNWLCVNAQGQKVVVHCTSSAPISEQVSKACYQSKFLPTAPYYTMSNACGGAQG